MNPKLIIADECISALDVSIQAQVVNLMKDIQQETGTAYLFIAHDLSMVKYISDRIGVLHLGHLLETVRPKRSSRIPSTPTPAACCRPSRCRTRWWKNAAWLRTYDYATSGIFILFGVCIHRTSASASCLPLAYIFSRPARFLVRVDIPSVLSGAMMQTRPCRSSSRARWTAVLYRHTRRRSPSAAAG